MIGGRKAMQKVPWLTSNLGKIQKIFGILMLLTALAIYMQWDRKFQTYILDKFPNYGTGLTKIEEAGFIEDELDSLFESSDEDKSAPKVTTKDLLERKQRAPELIIGGQWFNSEPLTLEELRGKVVLIDFWTYSCINCQRTFPYLRTWWEKYEDNGLVIIGVHAPEFEFEKDPENLQEAIEDFDLKYPVMQDNNFSTWRAYNNRYWPAKYIIDKDGYIRYTHFGEGAYDETERVIQQLLSELDEDMSSDLETDVNNPDYEIYSRTRETYLGFLRMNTLSSPEDVVQNAPQTYSAPERVPDNRFAFTGEWIVSEEYSNAKTGSELLLNFESKEVFLVMRSKEGSSRVRIYVDGEMQYPGEDVENGVVTVTKDTLYKLVELPEPGRHMLRIEFLDDNTEVYAFTFG
jgi:thiol-disulfide isomerase/thioredoxin